MGHGPRGRADVVPPRGSGLPLTQTGPQEGALDRLSQLQDHAAQGEPGRHHGRRSLAAEA